MALLKILRRRK